MNSGSKSGAWLYWAAPIMTCLMISIALAAPSSNSEDPVNPDYSRMYYRNRENIQNQEDNIIPMTLDSGSHQPQLPIYEPRVLTAQSSLDNAIFNYLLTRRLMLGNNRLRSFVDSGSNELSRKRSYSKYCAFNAVSCFGK